MRRELALVPALVALTACSSGPAGSPPPSRHPRRRPRRPSATSTRTTGSPCSSATAPVRRRSGYRLRQVRLPETVGEPGRVSFEVERYDGAPVTDYVVDHTKDLHLYVVRSDLAVFRHLHPTIAADGTWSGRGEPSRAGRLPGRDRVRGARRVRPGRPRDARPLRHRRRRLAAGSRRTSPGTPTTAWSRSRRAAGSTAGPEGQARARRLRRGAVGPVELGSLPRRAGPRGRLLRADGGGRAPPSGRAAGLGADGSVLRFDTALPESGLPTSCSCRCASTASCTRCRCGCRSVLADVEGEHADRVLELVEPQRDLDLPLPRAAAARRRPRRCRRPSASAAPLPRSSASEESAGRRRLPALGRLARGVLDLEGQGVLPRAPGRQGGEHDEVAESRALDGRSPPARRGASGSSGLLLTRKPVTSRTPTSTAASAPSRRARACAARRPHAAAARSG